MPARTLEEAAKAALLRVRALKLPRNACWPWPGKRNKQDYGKVWACNTEYLAHRMVYLAVHGSLPECVLHRCDHPPCGNPAHLFAGTRTDNARDRDRKKRMPTGDKDHKTVYPDAVVRELRARVAAGAKVARAAEALGIPYKYAWGLISQQKRRST